MTSGLVRSSPSCGFVLPARFSAGGDDLCHTKMNGLYWKQDPCILALFAVPKGAPLYTARMTSRLPQRISEFLCKGVETICPVTQRGPFLLFPPNMTAIDESKTFRSYICRG